VACIFVIAVTACPDLASYLPGHCGGEDRFLLHPMAGWLVPVSEKRSGVATRRDAGGNEPAEARGR